MTIGRFTRLILGTGLTGVDNGDDTITIAAASGGGGDPADDTAVWMPLVDSDGTVVLDDTGVIPTLVPIA